MFCQRCGAEASDDASFCARCGHDLGATTPVPAVAVAEPSCALDVVRQALQEDYEVREEIGRGGMAMVFRARERGLNRDVALKVLPLSHVHDRSLVERFQLEARTAAGLEHPNIIPIYRVGRAGEVIYFAMRYLTGPSLSELIQEGGAMEPGEVRRVLLQSAAALGYAHHHKIVHRDVKPDNILFKENGDVVVCDFGIAKAASGTALTGTGMAIGTPYYMSPEQVRAQSLDGRSDIYSLGIVAYQCLTRRVPFDGDDSFAIGYRHVTEELPVPDLPSAEHRALFRIVRRMTAKDPAERYATAEELAADLRRGWCAMGPTPEISTTAPTVPVAVESFGRRAAATRRASASATTATPTTPVPGAEPPRPRPGRKRVGALAATVVLVAGGTAGGAYYYEAAEGRPPPLVQRLPEGLTQRLAFLRDWSAGPAPEPHAASPSPPVLGAALAGDRVAAAPAHERPGPEGDSPALGADSTAEEPAPADSVVPDSSLAAPPTGHLVLSNMGRRSSLWIDDQPARGLRHELPVGEHQVRVSAPGFDPYLATVDVSVDDTLRHRVAMVAASQCDAFDEGTYNLRGECFDVRARPSRHLSTFVPLDGSVPRVPSRPAVLAIQVHPDGDPGTVLVRLPSDVPEFALRAVEFARGMTFEPATRRGRRVMSWLQVQFYPER